MASSNLFPDFTPFDIEVSPSITIHGLKHINSTNTHPPLLLIHGFPQTHHLWHSTTPALVSNYTIVLIDLRGYGASSKPSSSSDTNHKLYSKSIMASDCVTIMSSLFPNQKFNILAHDRGARVAHKLCVDHPEKVEKIMILDICPTLSMFSQTNASFAQAYWHWFFLTQASPFPEDLILANQSIFSQKFFGNPTYGGVGIFDKTAMEAYKRQLGDEKAVHGMCEDYRAAASIDLEEAKKDEKEGKKVKCDIRVLWGKKGVIEIMFDALKEWRAVCEGNVSGESVDSGHYVAEEQPELVVKHAKEFFA